MLLPDSNGLFVCKKDDYKTDNLFAYMDHFGVEYDWLVKLNPRYSLNLFTFLSEMTHFIDEGLIDDAWEHLQSVTLLMVNASGEDFDEFIQEAEVIAGTESIIDGLERYLDEDKRDN